ncbi:hypothetical protein [Magnetospirillum sp. 64-120]|uniref:hypothetical protein n=1 Tax=Magnetospirillum sp. 64-120 TaxID=1895778 RepID=UPI000926EF33|nr:hypothetical protein [Magnetospirillum sp. 64-120]OJX74822.1 MAG: hypothetical protein BGO92_14910 [Magnetospirillum sp. 64-120]
MSHPTLDNPFDRAAIRRMLSNVPPDAINHRAEIAEASSRFLEIVFAQYGEEGVQRFTELVREEAYAMARENAARQNEGAKPRHKGNGAFVVAVLLLLFCGIM